MRAILLLVALTACRTEGIQETDASSGVRGGSVLGIWDSGVQSKDTTPTDVNSKETADLKINNPADSKSDIPNDSEADTKLLGIGQNCKKSTDCAGGYCTDGVCCQVEKCVDSCFPSGINTCPVYSGWTCAPYGTCRAY